MLQPNLLLEVCSPTKLFGCLHGEDLRLFKDATNSHYMYAIGILHEPDVQSWDTLESDLELIRPWRRSYLCEVPAA